MQGCILSCEKILAKYSFSWASCYIISGNPVLGSFVMTIIYHSIIDEWWLANIFPLGRSRPMAGEAWTRSSGQNTVLGCSQRLALGLWRSTWLKWSFFVTRVFRHSQGRIKNYLQAVVIFRDTHFSSFTGGPNWAFRCLDCGINNWKTDSKSKVYRPQFWRKNVNLEWVQIKRDNFQC